MTLKQIIAEERGKLEKEFPDIFHLPEGGMSVWLEESYTTQMSDFLVASNKRVLEAQAKELVERVEKEKTRYVNERVDFVVQTTRYIQGLTRAQDIIRTSLNE